MRNRWLRWKLNRNPFVPQPPRDAEIRRRVFTGRRSEVERILSCAEAGEPCCLYGTYGIGKSMLMLHVNQHILETSPGTVPVYQRYLAGQGFDSAVLEGAVRELRKRGLSVEMHGSSAMLSLRRLMEAANSRGLHLFALIDDTDRAQDLLDIKAIIDSIRELRDLGCGVCVPGNPNNVTHWFGTRAQGILDVINVEPFSTDEYLDMAARYLESARESQEARYPVRVFLSYARADAEIVSNLFAKLTNLGFRPWMDEKNLLGGENWRSAIKQAIEDSDFVLLCVSKKSRDRRGFLQAEVSKALDILEEQLEDDIYLIPVRLEQCDPPRRVANLQYIDLFREGGLSQIERSLREGWLRRNRRIEEEADNTEARDFGPFSEPALRLIINRVGVDALTPRSFNTACRTLLELLARSNHEQISPEFVEENWEHVGGQILASEGDIERMVRIVRELLKYNGIIDEESLDLDSLLAMLNRDFGSFADLVDEVNLFGDVFRVEQQGAKQTISMSPLIDHGFVRNVLLQKDIDEFRHEYQLPAQDDESEAPQLAVEAAVAQLDLARVLLSDEDWPPEVSR